MLIDPRPYTYEYRKPRYGNPTYQSRNLYESIYHRYSQEPNDYFPHQQRAMYSSTQKLPKKDPYPQQYKELERNLSEVRDRRTSDLGYYKSNTQPVNNPPPESRPMNEHNPERQMQGYKLPSINQSTERARAENNIGSNIQAAGERRTDNPIQRRNGFQRFRIYERQQKPFNIISCYPKEDESNKLRTFPKLTLEDKLRERGSYHDFKEDNL